MATNDFDAFLAEIEEESTAVGQLLDLEEYRKHFKRKASSFEQCRCCGGIWCQNCDGHIWACICGGDL